jgi:hypothetical protein
VVRCEGNKSIEIQRVLFLAFESILFVMFGHVGSLKIKIFRTIFSDGFYTCTARPANGFFGVLVGNEYKHAK